MLTRTHTLSIIACALLAACSQQAPQTPGAGGVKRAAALTIVGAGSTFDYPFFSRAFYEYSKNHPAVTVNYQSIGSGGGIRQFSARTVDFGATDVPMNAKDLAAIPGDRPVIQAPVTLGGVAIAYNVPAAAVRIKLTSTVLSGIFLGTITNWNDRQIAQSNPDLHVTSLPIAVVHRADGSGTTYILTDYLSQISAQWKSKAGTGKTVSWPAASSMGVKGTEGVAGQIRNTPGAIGYVELTYAKQNGLSYAVVQNKAGTFVLPTSASVAAAAAAKPNVTPTDFSIVNQDGAQTYPIAGYSWLLLYQHYPDFAKQKALHDLFVWLATDGQQVAKSIEYVPLPAAASKAALAAINRVGKR